MLRNGTKFDYLSGHMICCLSQFAGGPGRRVKKLLAERADFNLIHQHIPKWHRTETKLPMPPQIPLLMTLHHNLWMTPHRRLLMKTQRSLLLTTLLRPKSSRSREPNILLGSATP